MDARRTHHDGQHDGEPHLLTARSRRTLVGLGLSLVIHVFILGLLALILLEGPARGDGPDFGPALEISTGVSNADASAADAWLDESLPDLASAVPMPEVSFETTNPAVSMVAAGAASPASLAGGAGRSNADGLSLGGAAGGGASFFGVEASGSRIVYIVDISGSMLHNGKIDALKRELLGSIASLPPGSEFAVVVFSDETSTRSLGGSARWRSSTAGGRADIETAIRGISPSGGTEPLEAFRIAFGLGPKPEAIYFMTDGELPKQDATRIIGTVKQMNRRKGETAPIHCIAFGSKQGASDLRRIGRQSGGSYTYVDVRRTR